MIETIYSSAGGENERTGVQPVFKMPKNIRQIGRSNAAKKIYIEDYVMTYIRQLAGGEYAGRCLAVLVGQCVKQDGCRNIFISGAVRVKDMEAANELVFTNETWTGIYEDIKKYFTDMEIVGWYIGGPGYLMSDEEKIQKTHVDNFAGQDKVLLTYDNLEKEELFLCYENSRLCRQEGYYIYYEKNEEMQTYIIDQKDSKSCEADYDDKISRDIRTVIQNKQIEKDESKSVTRLMYAAGTLLAVIVLIIGAAMLRNYDQMKNMQDTLQYLSDNMKEVQANFAEGEVPSSSETSDISDDDQAVVTKGAEEKSADNGDSLDVQVIPGNVEPIAEDADQSENVESRNNNQESTSDKELAGESKEKDTANPKQEDSTTADTGTKQTSADTGSKQTKAEINYYIVKEGDTLADISFKLYHTYTKVKKIMELNGITDQDLVYVGQKLVVP